MTRKVYEQTEKDQVDDGNYLKQVEVENVREKGEIIRTRADLTREIIPFNVQQAMGGVLEDDLSLNNLDEVHLYSHTEFQDTWYVAIDGAIRRPGIYALMDSMTVADLVSNYIAGRT